MAEKDLTPDEVAAIKSEDAYNDLQAEKAYDEMVGKVRPEPVQASPLPPKEISFLGSEKATVLTVTQEATAVVFHIHESTGKSGCRISLNLANSYQLYGWLREWLA